MSPNVPVTTIIRNRKERFFKTEKRFLDVRYRRLEESNGVYVSKRRKRK